MSEEPADYRTNSLGFKKYFTSDDGRELESDFGFRDKHYLESKLNTIFTDFDLLTNHINNRRANDDIKRLKIISIRANKLCEILNKTSLEQRLLNCTPN